MTTRVLHHSSRTLRPSVALGAVSCLLLPVLASAQAPDAAPQGATSLDAVLERLEANNQQYDHKIPNLFASEHVVSELLKPGTFPAQEHTETDSVFRLKRSTGKDGMIDLKESREVKRINGKPVANDPANIEGPSILHGVFAAALNIVSVRGKPCFHFILLPARGRDKGRIVVGFENNALANYGPDCPPFENTTGRAVIDPKTMHVVRLEKKTPHHELYEGVFGTWVWTADYAPVELNGESFFLPRSISSRAEYTPDGSSADAASLRSRPDRTLAMGLHTPLTWTFVATYKDFHLLTAKSRLLDGDQSEPTTGP